MTLAALRTLVQDALNRPKCAIYVAGASGALVELSSDDDLRKTDATLRDLYIR